MNRILIVALFALSVTLPLSALNSGSDDNFDVISDDNFNGGSDDTSDGAFDGNFDNSDDGFNGTFNSTNNTEPQGPWNIAPDARQVSLRDLKYKGRGCPPGSVAAKLQDNQINFEFAQLSVTKGNHSLNHDDYKECSANFTMHVPRGWSYRLSSHEVDGFAEIPRHITVFMNARTQFLDVPMARDSVKNVTISRSGPMEKPFGFGEGWGDIHERHSWSQCGKSQRMSLNTIMRLDGPQGTPHAYVGGDKTPHGRVKQILYLAWEKCIR